MTTVSTPIVLLHGATSSKRCWAGVLPYLLRHPTWVPTLAGHLGGPTLHVAPEAVVAGIVDDLVQRMDDEGIGAAHLVGNSLGGWVALELARRGRARSVSAFSPAGAWASSLDLSRLLTSFRLAALLGRTPAVRRIVAGPFGRRALSRVARHPERLTDADVAVLAEDLAGCTVLADLLSGARVNGGFRALRPTCPVTLAWGTDDRILPWRRYGAPLAARVEGARVVAVPGAGHVPMIDDPAFVARTILQTVAWSGAA